MVTSRSPPPLIPPTQDPYLFPLTPFQVFPPPLNGLKEEDMAGRRF